MVAEDVPELFRYNSSPFGLSARQLARRLGVFASTLTRLVSGASRVSPEIELRLSKVLGRSAESWLAMQDAHHLWEARQRLDLDQFSRLDLASA